MPAFGELLGRVAEEVAVGSPWGIGIVAVAAVALAGRDRAKPLAKGAIKRYLSLSQRAQEWAAEAVDQAQDLYAEAKHEYRQYGAVGDTAPTRPPVTVPSPAAATPEAAAAARALQNAGRGRRWATRRSASLRNTSPAGLGPSGAS
jgi:hypothetical protein